MEPQPPSDLERQRRLVLRVVALVLAASVVFAASKAWAGREFDSVAIRSDAANNFADVLYLSFLMWGLALSLRPSDLDHPEGHLRFESLMGLVVASAVLATSALVLRHAWNALHRGTDPLFAMPAVGILAAVAAAKLGLARLLWRAERISGRPSLGMIARDQQADVGATCAALAGPLAGKLAVPWLDAVVAFPIGIYIAWTGVGIALRTIHQLTGRAAPPEVLAGIAAAVREHPCFEALHNVRTHHVGPEIFVSLDVEADPAISLAAIHEHEEALRATILGLPGVARVFVHVEPVGTPREGHDCAG